MKTHLRRTCREEVGECLVNDSLSHMKKSLKSRILRHSLNFFHGVICFGVRWSNDPQRPEYSSHRFKQGSISLIIPLFFLTLCIIIIFYLRLSIFAFSFVLCLMFIIVFLRCVSVELEFHLNSAPEVNPCN